MSLYDSFLNLKFDKRMKTWNLTQGLVTEKEIKEDLENLTDVTENAEPMVLFPSPEPKNTDQSPSQEQEAPQTQQEPSLTNEKDDTAYNTQPPVAIDQDSLQQQEQIATEETAVNKDEDTQKTNEDPSNPWW